MNSLKLEAGKYGILVHAVAPVALTRMIELLPFCAMQKERSILRAGLVSADGRLRKVGLLRP